MIQLDGLPVTIAGAGALGLASAVRLAAAGARVRVCDPALGRDSASAVAAGMVAPAFEVALDPVAPPYPLLVAARDLWPSLLEAAGAAPDLLDRSGALLAAPDAEALVPAQTALAGAGARVERLEGAALRNLQPALAPGLHGLYTPEDWRIAPPAALAALAAGVERLGGRLQPAAVALGPGGASVAGEAVEGVLVIAAGMDAAGLAPLAPELDRLAPIKGQILHFAAGPLSGPTVRGLAGYVAPQPGGAVAGASMEPGRDDRTLDPEALGRLRTQAEALVPGLRGARAEGRAGVRAATPDGLPLVGRSASGAILATGARRNGWLLAPLVAETLVRIVAGRGAGEHGQAFDPARFD